MDQVVDKIKKLIDNSLRDKAIEFVDATYKRESGVMVLRLLVDKVGGITLDECASLNEEIGDMLEREDAVFEKYTLEVSSPGLDRQLKTRRDFERIMGKEIHVHTYSPINDKRDCEGAVKFVDDQKVIVGDMEIPLDKISKAKLKIEI